MGNYCGGSFSIGNRLIVYFWAGQTGFIRDQYVLVRVLYINGGFAAFMALRENSLYDLLPIGLANAHIGELVIWLLLLTTWASDTFAYLRRNG